ncbi:MAG: LPS assembly lipoprotein LptE [Opitutales bacterium]
MGLACVAQLALILLSGCGHYALGPTGQPPFTTLYVETVTNDSLAPQAASLTSKALREAFLRDGRVKLVDSPVEAEATLSLRLINYRRSAASFRSDDTAQANSFKITLEGEASLTENRPGGKSLFEGRLVRGVARLAWDDPATSPDGRQSLVAASRDLSDETVSMTLDAW